MKWFLLLSGAALATSEDEKYSRVGAAVLGAALSAMLIENDRKES